MWTQTCYSLFHQELSLLHLLHHFLPSLSLLLQQTSTHYIFPSLSPQFCKRQEVHITFSILYLSSPATGSRCISPPPYPPPPATSKKYTLHFPLALSLLLQQPTSTRCIFLCLSLCPCDKQQVHITFSLGSASPPATGNKYTLHLPSFLSSCNRQQTHITSSLLSLLLQQATSTHYIFPAFSPLATGNKYTLHLPSFFSSCNRQQTHITSSLLSLLLQQATNTHYIFPAFSPLATGNKYTWHLPLSLSFLLQQLSNIDVYLYNYYTSPSPLVSQSESLSLSPTQQVPNTHGISSFASVYPPLKVFPCLVLSSATGTK